MVGDPVVFWWDDDQLCWMAEYGGRVGVEMQRVLGKRTFFTGQRNWTADQVIKDLERSGYEVVYDGHAH